MMRSRSSLAVVLCGLCLEAACGSSSTSAPDAAIADATMIDAPQPYPLDFWPKADLISGTNSYAVALGDLNQDGRPDLAVGTTDVAVLLDQTATAATTPIFLPKVDAPAGGNPAAVAFGDVNGDGKPDVVETNEGPATVSVLLDTTPAGPSVASFAPSVDFGTGSAPLGVAVGDLNGDGRPDLAVADFGDQTVSVLLDTTATGATAPTFSPKADFTVGLSPSSVAMADLNGDGKLDLAVVNVDAYTVSVLLNTTPTGASTPSFAAKVDFDTGPAPQAIAVGDFNGDGRPDLAVVDFGSNVSVLLDATASGASAPSFSPRVDFPTTARCDGIAVADLNGDGKPDVAVTCGEGGDIAILLDSTPTGATTPELAAEVDFMTGSPRSIAIGDLNGDHRPDLAVANDNPAEGQPAGVSVFLAK
jgi:hypothetical protein